jgi:hypothetical protein
MTQMGANIKEVLKETGYEKAGLIQMTRDSVQWRSF